MSAHPIQQPIRAICVIGQSPGDGGEQYIVGIGGTVKIVACTKPGLHCDIPYVRVYSAAGCEAEFCQHNIIGVYFDPSPDQIQETEHGLGGGV